MDFLDAEIARRRQIVAELQEKLRAEEIGLRALEETVRLRPAPITTEAAESSAPPIAAMRRRAPIPAPLEESHDAQKVDGRFGQKRPPIRERLSEPVETVAYPVLIVRALIERYPEGATSQQLASFIANQYNRITTPNTFSVMLNQLKKLGEIRTEHLVWHLVDKEAKA